MPVRQRLLLILPDGALYDYLAPITPRPLPSLSHTLARKLGISAAATTRRPPLAILVLAPA